VRCSKLDSTVPAHGGAQLDIIATLNNEVAGICAEYLELLEGIKIRAAIAKALEASAAGNKFLQARTPSLPRTECPALCSVAAPGLKLQSIPRS
jgi:methionyl-tRNA synthetase